MTKSDTMVRALGWFSIGLGVAEVAMPAQVGLLIGVRRGSGILRLYGLREIFVGVGLLTQQPAGRPSRWLWARVAGDLLDIATVGAHNNSDNPDRERAVSATAALTAIALIDFASAQNASRIERERLVGNPPGVAVGALTIDRSADDLYWLWKQPDARSRVLESMAKVSSTGDGSEHWQLTGPLGKTVEWDTRLTTDRPGEMVHWKTLNGVKTPYEGSLEFRPAPGDRGTEVIMRMQFDPPGGPLGEAMASLLKIVPDMAITKVLRRFKSLAETGEIPTTREQPAARADRS